MQLGNIVIIDHLFIFNVLEKKLIRLCFHSS